MSLMTMAALSVVNGFALGVLTGVVLSGTACATACAGAKLARRARR
jgi:hypothetical protein